MIKTFSRVTLVYESADREESDTVVSTVFFNDLDNAFANTLVAIFMFHGNEVDFFRVIGPFIGFKYSITEYENGHGLITLEYSITFSFMIADERNQSSFLFMNQQVDFPDTAIKVREGLFEDIPLEIQLVPHHFHGTENLSGILWGSPLVLAFPAGCG